MDLTKIDDLRTAMKLAGIKPKKTLGQHFLVDRDSLEAVMAGADLVASDTVLEIGPGLGVMTMPLTERVAKVWAVETDPLLAELLKNHKLANLEIHQSDVMKFDFRGLPTGYKVVANIPYYITSPIIRLLLESANRPKLVSILIQKEVAERIVAEPGQMSVLALSVQYYAKAEIVGVVQRDKFWPIPAVDSAILRLEVYQKPVFEANTAVLFKIIKAGFGEKRKQLRNSLSGGLHLSAGIVEAVLRDCHLAATARAQELSLADWQRLYLDLTNKGLV